MNWNKILDSRFQLESHAFNQNKMFIKLISISIQVHTLVFYKALNKTQKKNFWMDEWNFITMWMNKSLFESSLLSFRVCGDGEKNLAF